MINIINTINNICHTSVITPNPKLSRGPKCTLLAVLCQFWDTSALQFMDCCIMLYFIHYWMRTSLWQLLCPEDRVNVRAILWVTESTIIQGPQWSEEVKEVIFSAKWCTFHSRRLVIKQSTPNYNNFVETDFLQSPTFMENRRRIYQGSELCQINLRKAFEIYH